MFPFLNSDHRPDEPNTDDKVVVDVRFPGRDIKRGMVIMFHAPHDPKKWVTKRVVAVQGDIVQPKLPYHGVGEGGRGVIVPFGHVWVEGDVEDRERSVDSNWYGPISRNLIIGTVIRVVWPSQLRSVPVRWQEWKGIGSRLEEDAVNLADPDEDEINDKFFDGTAQDMLDYLRRNGRREELMKSREGRQGLKDTWVMAQREAQKKDPQTVGLAEEILTELTKPIPASVLAQK